MEDCSTNNSSSRRKKKEDTLALLQKLLPPKVNKHKTPRTFEYKRSSNTGKRIYKPKVQPRKKYKKTTGNLQISSTKDIPFDDEDALIYEAETDGNIDYFVSMDNNKNLVKDNAELNSVHECLQTLKRLLPAPKKRHRKSWFHRVITTQNQWARIRPVIKDVMLSREVPKGVCNICQEREVVIKCNMCLESFLCYVCDDIIHTSNPVHDRSFISKGITTTLSPLEIVDDNFEIVQTERFPKIKCFSCSSCGSKNLVKRCSKDMCAVIIMHGAYQSF
ncbi:uncharacterized protein LOC130648699 [Hydractinia symbiolongicarpus]|uniref:uncharacterized protein LOC130648699 n=1 Tax=Hydractinia symbiolongicarpus TaxID=13093 RepID=UPI00254CEA80|nr:uncharacterized protein LOC130648699 [Hydractinia symbiolongicarpus]